MQNVPKTKAELKIAELEARAEDMRAEGCEKLAEILETWAETLKTQQTIC